MSEAELQALVRSIEELRESQRESHRETDRAIKNVAAAFSSCDRRRGLPESPMRGRFSQKDSESSARPDFHDSESRGLKRPVNPRFHLEGLPHILFVAAC